MVKIHFLDIDLDQVGQGNTRFFSAIGRILISGGLIDPDQFHEPALKVRFTQATMGYPRGYIHPF